MANFEKLQDFSILFADVEGFSKFSAFHQKQYLNVVLPLMAQALESTTQPPEQSNTWGDGLMAYYASAGPAVRGEPEG